MNINYISCLKTSRLVVIFVITAFPVLLQGSLLVDMERIPSGAFEMGDHLDGSTSTPVVTVDVSAFYMGKYEVTKALWNEVRTWGLSNGYSDLSSGNGRADNHPVYKITWYDMVKWCNARSEKEGRTPCYSVSGSTYRTGISNSVDCDWTANGYRLPTQAEWEKAARGGLIGKRFPWGDTISHANANYYESTWYSYDTGDGSGYYPSSLSGSPKTSAVGSFAANGYGLYDMSGNVWEWCWDFNGGTYTDGASDPRGPSSGTNRIIRGGSWNARANACRVVHHQNLHPSTSDKNGFRVATIDDYNGDGNLDGVLYDSDGDGLNDFIETNTGIYVSATNTGTDPNNSDSSGDGLEDGFVVAAGLDPTTNYSVLFTASAINALGYYSSTQMEDARAGSVGILSDGSSATLQLQIERSQDLETWTSEENDLISIPVDIAGDKQFFRFAMPQE